MAQIRDIDSFAKAGEVALSYETVALVEAYASHNGFSFQNYPGSDGRVMELCCHTSDPRMHPAVPLILRRLYKHSPMPESETRRDLNAPNVDNTTREMRLTVPYSSGDVARAQVNDEKRSFQTVLNYMTQNQRSWVFRVLRSHIPAIVQDDIATASHHSPLAQLSSQFRVCTVLFVGFPFLTEPLGQRGGICKPEEYGSVASVQASAEVVAKALQQHGGSFVQFRCDEKGCAMKGQLTV
jgi:hypothetical protein